MTYLQFFPKWAIDCNFRHFRHSKLKALIRYISIITLFFCEGCFVNTPEKLKENNFAIIDDNDTEKQIIKKAANITPTENQYNWQKLETTAFIHFTVNTFTDEEWGYGTESPEIFDPTQLDTRQWVEVCKDAGLKMIIVTAKHHDGFCMWPSRYTGHSVKNSPYKNGKGDIVKELSKACCKAGLKFGVYLSPWDRHEKTYGTPAYNTYFLNQLTELLSNYGPVDEVWFDGACGEGPNGNKQEYDWKSYYALIRKLQPKAVIAVAGPDVRWVGTESGYGRKTEWSVVSASSRNKETITENSQQEVLDDSFKPIDMTNEDLGSRVIITKAQKLVWYPSEVDVSIRSGWFYHQSQDALVKTPEKLLDIYYSSVGRNSLLLLNIPPDRRGLIHENDIKSLKEWRNILNVTFKNNLIEKAEITSSSQRRKHPAKALTDNNPETYWETKIGDSTATLDIDFYEAQTFDVLMLKENIRIGQRIESFKLECLIDNEWVEITKGTTVGYKRLLRFPAVKTKYARLIIEQSRLNPTLIEMGLFKRPPKVAISPEAAVFTDNLKIELSSDDADANIYFTLDGSDPDKDSQKYTEPVFIHESTILRAVSVSKNGEKGIIKIAEFGKAKYNISGKNKFSEKYPAKGLNSLVDGLKGSLAYNDGKWQGYEGVNLETIIDFGKLTQINSISSSYLQNTKAWIFAPQRVEYEVSNDSKNFKTIYTEDYKLDLDKKDEVLIKEFAAKPKNIEAKYLKVKAINMGKCPEWHDGDGGNAWLFVDEIIVL